MFFLSLFQFSCSLISLGFSNPSDSCLEDTSQGLENRFYLIPLILECCFPVAFRLPGVPGHRLFHLPSSRVSAFSALAGLKRAFLLAEQDGE